MRLFGTTSHNNKLRVDNKVYAALQNAAAAAVNDLAESVVEIVVWREVIGFVRLLNLIYDVNRAND